jgi:hypothetical protein
MDSLARNNVLLGLCELIVMKNLPSLWSDWWKEILAFTLQGDLFAFLLVNIQMQLLSLRFSLCYLFKIIKICKTYNWRNYFTYSSAEFGVTVSNRFV